MQLGVIDLSSPLHIIIYFVACKNVWPHRSLFEWATSSTQIQISTKLVQLLILLNGFSLVVMALSSRMELDNNDDVFLQDHLGPTIAEHALQCTHLFQKYMAMPEITPDPTLMDDQFARFTLWTSNMDVFGPLNVSLDYRLRYSSQSWTLSISFWELFAKRWHLVSNLETYPWHKLI